MTTQLMQPPAQHRAASAPPGPRNSRPTRLPYHRQALTHPRPRWWRPLLTILYSAIAYLVLTMAVFIVCEVLALFRPELAPAITGWVQNDAAGLDTPVGLLLGAGLLALLIPAVAIGVRLAEKQSLGRLSSIAGRLRGGLLLPMLGLAVLVFIPYLAIEGLVQWRQGSLDIAFSREALFLVAIALFVLPFQAAAEEYIFRGLPQQVLGAWLRSPWWGILVPIPFFVLGHTYDLYGQTNIAIFALATGILVWRTGGLEAAIALHVVNNLVVSIGDSVGLIQAATHEVSAVQFWASTAIIVIFTVLALAFHHRVTWRAQREGQR